jgi:hypothetical protein
MLGCLEDAPLAAGLPLRATLDEKEKPFYAENERTGERLTVLQVADECCSIFTSKAYTIRRYIPERDDEQRCRQQEERELGCAARNPAGRPPQPAFIFVGPAGRNEPAKRHWLPNDGTATFKFGIECDWRMDHFT